VACIQMQCNNSTLSKKVFELHDHCLKKASAGYFTCPICLLEFSDETFIGFYNIGQASYKMFKLYLNAGGEINEDAFTFANDLLAVTHP